MKIAALLTSLALSTFLAAQPPPANPAEATLAKDATKILTNFASTASSKKFGPMEKQALSLIISDYDPDNARARKELGYEKVEGAWKQTKTPKRKRWGDFANREGRYKIQQEWREACVKLGAAHRQLGLALKGADGLPTPEGVKHLELAILYDPFDAPAHQALGHKPWESGGTTYYGTETQIAFMQRMKEIETQALMLAKKEYPVQVVDKIPDELNKLGLEIYGAKSEHFCVFVRGTQQNADDLVKWGERALEFLDYVVGKDEKAKKVARLEMKRWAWIGYLWTPLEFGDFKEANPDLIPDRAKEYANIDWVRQDGIRSVTSRLTPAQMQDHLIAYVFHYGLDSDALNAGMLEGIHHAATWFLKSTCITEFGADPEGSVTEDDLRLPEGANWWLREMRNQAVAHTDLPLDTLPRIALSKFKPEARLKSWSFAVYAMARYPNGAWLEFARQLPRDPVPELKKVESVAASVFKQPLAAVEAEWREWASGRGATAAATGYGPPLLPEAADQVELDGLDRLTQVRAVASCMPVFEKGSEAEKTAAKAANAGGFIQGLPECEIDSEATAACKDHCLFLGKHEDHWKWPEAHEEDPAKEGFSPRGMRAGMASVIVLVTSPGKLDAKDSVDQWIGTVYHRFPLLEYNIKRFGIAHEGGPIGETCALDMGSLQEPPDDTMERQFAFVAWPPDGMKRVPRQFSYTEHPNPLEDVGLDFDAQKNTGYPVSLQFTEHVMMNSAGTTMKLYEAKKRGGTYENGDEIPCWLHTPDAPLLKRMVMRDVVFVIPKEILAADETYKAVVDLVYRGVPKKIEWTFTTGSSMNDLGQLKPEK